jgi:hypothetical protein
LSMASNWRLSTTSGYRPPPYSGRFARAEDGRWPSPTSLWAQFLAIGENLCYNRYKANSKRRLAVVAQPEATTKAVAAAKAATITAQGPPTVVVSAGFVAF